MVVSACLAAAAMLAACGGNSGASAPGSGTGGAGGSGGGRRGAGSGATIAVKTTTIQRIAVDRQVELAGNLLSPDQAKVSAEVAGVVRQVLVELGTEVRVGQPLVRIEPKELELALARAESALRQTYAQLGMHANVTSDTPPPADEQVAAVRTGIANLEDAKAAMARADALAARGILSPVDLQAAQTRLKVAEAGYQSAFDTARSLKAQLQDRRAAFDLAQKKLADTVVKAPIAGAVVDRYVQTGEFIPELTLVATIVQVNPLKLRTGVQERYAGAIQSGQRVEFRVASFGDAVFKGKIAFVSPSIDQTMRTFQVEALVENDDRRLKPGFFAKGVIFTSRDENVMALPDAAVSTLAGVSSVFIVDKGKIRQASVTLGSRQGNVWEVVDGLKGDEVLAASNLNNLATGVNVKVQAPGESDDGSAAGGRRGQGRGQGRGDRSGGGGQGQRQRGDRP